MEGFSIWHLLIIALVLVILFGGRKIPEMMRGLGQGINEFKKGMRDESNTPPPPSTTSAPPPTEPKK